MSRIRSLLLSLAVATAVLVVTTATASEGEVRPLPEFTHTEAATWLNSPPLTVAELRGRVVMIDFWTFDCWNCIRSLPWLHDVAGHGLFHVFTLVGVHTPEFAHERKRSRLLDKVKLLGIEHPVMIDNDFSYWNATATRYWPTFYLVDKHGLVRGSFLGETRIDQPRAREVEQLIEQLLAEQGPL